MFEIGRLCLKIAGRDAGLKCIIIDKLNDSYVLINGQTRRRKCNIKHLEPLDNVLKIKKGLVHDDVVKELRKEGIEIKEKIKRSKKTKEAKTEEKPEVKKEKERPELKKEKPAAKPKKKAVKKVEAKPKKTVVKKAPVKKAVKEKVSKAKPKAKTTKK